jgi:hypothetical protein
MVMVEGKMTRPQAVCARAFQVLTHAGGESYSGYSPFRGHSPLSGLISPGAIRGIPLAAPVFPSIILGMLLGEMGIR